jgi:hypothetical protein
VWLTAQFSESTYCHKLIGCLQFSKLPTAIEVSPALVLANDDWSSVQHADWQPGFDEAASPDQKARGPLRVVHLALGFEDGSVLEQSLALRVNDKGSSGEPCEALWWEERAWHSGAEGYHFADSGQDSGVGGVST